MQTTINCFRCHNNNRSINRSSARDEKRNHHRNHQQQQQQLLLLLRRRRRRRNFDDESYYVKTLRIDATGKRKDDDTNNTNINNSKLISTSTFFGLPREDVAKPLAGLLLSQFILFVGVGVLLPALPLYAQSIGLSQSANGLVISAPALAMLILNVQMGQMADKYGRKPMMITGLIIMALADVCTGLAKTMLFLIPARFSSRRFNESSTKETRHNITASQAMVHGLGLVIGPFFNWGFDIRCV